MLQVLQLKFKRYFENNQSAIGNALDFSIGCGLDEGEIFAVRVGIRGINDVAWVGRCINTSAKLANTVTYPQPIAITRAVYDRLNNDRKFAEKDGEHMWSDERMQVIGGVNRAIRTTNYWWSIG